MMKVYRVELMTVAHVAAPDVDTANRVALEGHMAIIEEYGIAVHKTVEVPEASVLTDEGFTVLDKATNPN